MDYDTATANARLDATETFIGTSPKLRIYNGVKPANSDAALSGNTLLAEGALPSDWMATAASKQKLKAGTWTVTGLAGAGGGTPGTFFRIYDSTGTNCRMQGTFSGAGGGGEMTADNASIALNQVINVSTFQINHP